MQAKNYERTKIDNLTIQLNGKTSSGSKKRTTVFRRRIFGLLTGLFIAICASMSFGAFFVSAQESNGSADITDCKESTTYYKSIRIENGDTLWAIASENLPKQYDSVEEYIEVLKDMNNLSSDEIRSGENLIIIYTHN